MTAPRGDRGATPAQAAIAWVAAQPGVRDLYDTRLREQVHPRW